MPAGQSDHKVVPGAKAAIIRCVEATTDWDADDEHEQGQNTDNGKTEIDDVFEIWNKFRLNLRSSRYFFLVCVLGEYWMKR